MSSDIDFLLCQMLAQTQLRRPVRRRQQQPGEPLSASPQRRAAKLAQRRKKAKRKQGRR